MEDDRLGRSKARKKENEDPEIFESSSPEETFQIGKAVGEDSEKGEIYLLSGDLGAGKTVFAKGFAAGLGVDEDVTSPTFTIVKAYMSGRIPLYHFDAYRIADPDELYAIGYEEYFYGDGISLIEWPEMVSELIPKDAVLVTIKRRGVEDQDRREIRIYRSVSIELK